MAATEACGEITLALYAKDAAVLEDEPAIRSQLPIGISERCGSDG
jgi:hypothetical protein